MNSSTISILKNIQLLFFVALWCCNPATKKIDYGSNNGKHIRLYDKLIYYEEYGNGTPLLLLSGGGLERSIKDFEKCIPDLSKHYRVIAPDTPGQGRSEPADTLSYEVITQFMSQFIDSLQLDSVNVIGWSDGGIVGLLLAEKRPDKIRKVISVGPNNGLGGAMIPADLPLDSIKIPSLDEWEKNYKESVDNYMALMPRDWKKVLSDLFQMWYAKEYFSNSVYDGINVPVMIVLGDRDDIKIEHGLEMHRSIKGSEFCVLPNTSHGVFTDNPDLINKIAIDFFER